MRTMVSFRTYRQVESTMELGWLEHSCSFATHLVGFVMHATLQRAAMVSCLELRVQSPRRHQQQILRASIYALPLRQAEVGPPFGRRSC